MKKKKVHLYLFADLFYWSTVVLHNTISMSQNSNINQIFTYLLT